MAMTRGTDPVNRNHTMNRKLVASALFLGMFMSLNLQAQPVKEHGKSVGQRDSVNR